MKKNLIIILVCLNFNVFFGQNNISNLLHKSIEGVNFSDFQSNPFGNYKKPKINFGSNKFALQYKSKILELYKTAKVNFGGHYIIIFWNAGMGSSQGVMVDSLTGNVFDIPVNDDTSTMACFSDESINKFNLEYGAYKIFFSQTSNLLVTRDCDESGDKIIRFHFFEWNEKIKKFKKFKTISKPI